MTVLDVVRKYDLADYKEEYYNPYGNYVSLKYSLDDLAKQDVKDVYINLKTKTANITIIDF